MVLGSMAKFEQLDFTFKSGEIVTIRHCSPNDAEAFIGLQKQIASETQFTLQGAFNTPTPERIRKHFEEFESSGRGLHLGAFESHGIQIAAAILEPEREGHPWIQHVAQFGMMIRKAYWGQGLARKLLNLLEEFALSHNYKRIEALVRVGNDRAMSLYQQAGYSIEGTRKCAAIIDGHVWDEYYIAKIVEF
jgi:RimJ/RimL family protein N-acetyltransferase